MNRILAVSAVLLIFAACACAVECPPGFKWVRMSGVGCVQEDCISVGGSYGYTQNCFCRTLKGCYERVDYTSFDAKKCGANCPYSRLIACVASDAKCPNEGPTKKECDDYCHSYHNPNSEGTPKGMECDCKCKTGYEPDRTLTCKPTAAYCKQACTEYHGPSVDSKVVEDHCDCKCKTGYAPDETLTCKPEPKATTTTSTSTTSTTLGLKMNCNFDRICDADESPLACCHDCACPMNLTCVSNKCTWPDKEACKDILSRQPSFLGLTIPTESSIGAELAEFDLHYDNYMLQTQMMDALEEYQKKYGRALTRPLDPYGGASPKEFAALMKHLGSHTLSQTDPEYYKENFYTGREAALRQAVSEEYAKRGRELDPSEVFEISLKLNNGVVYNSILTCHNFLRGAARGNEDFSGQTLPDGSTFTGKATDDQKRNGIQDTQLSGEARDRSIFAMLKPLRQTDDEGAWYHLFGTMLAGYAQSEDIIAGSDIAEQGLNLEHYYVKNRFDAIEYCWDVWGVRLGASIYNRVRAAEKEDMPVIVRFPQGPGTWADNAPLYIPRIREGYAK